MKHDSLITVDPWNALQGATQARIALGRSGGSLPTVEWLAFKTAHAAARDAVHNRFDAEALAAEIAGLGVETIVVSSAAADRSTYLQRPDLGRRLDAASRDRLEAAAKDRQSQPELAIIVSDGLSALAAERQAVGVLSQLMPLLLNEGWRIAPLAVARFGRVALEDEIGAAVGAEAALMLIGERPGLGSPDSLGAYLVYGPQAGNTDAHRNCVSNIRPEGLPWEAAAQTLAYLLGEARRRKLSGVALKDERSLSDRLQPNNDRLSEAVPPASLPARVHPRAPSDGG
ncbi:MAG: ethanolamine ammonia-lyase subunit EutC [Pirellulales bacterium]|nr:ethanolamine ammonia-lyase subunit EutC [Pirellulales bacterium]